VGTCSEDGFCQIQVTEAGSWGVNNNELCLLMGENEDPTGSKEYLCGEYIFSDDEKSFTLTLILNTTECFILNLNQLKYTISINGTTEIFDHTSFIVDWQAAELTFETNFIEVVNDTVFQVAYQEPNSNPVETNTIITPLFPSLGSAWQGMFGGPANFEVQKLTNIVVPADTALAYIYQIHEEDSGEHRGSMTFSEDIGMLSMMQIFGSDTFSIVLESYTIVGGNGVFPLAIGNEWIFVDGNYDDIQIQGCTEEEACNYDKHADINDGSCEYIAVGTCDCDGKLIDCAGICGGDAVLDACGVCDSDPANNNACFTYPAEFIGNWGTTMNLFYNSECTGSPSLITEEGMITLNTDSSLTSAGNYLRFDCPDYFTGNYLLCDPSTCMDDTDCAEEVGSDFQDNVNICNEDGYCTTEFSYSGAWGINDSLICVLFESDYEQGSFSCYDHNFSVKDLTMKVIIDSSSNVGEEYCRQVSLIKEGTQSISDLIPLEYALHQNYPNPFNPVTTISFSIPKFGLTSIKVYDLTGRELATLTNEFLNPGSYSISWEASSHPSGMYFVKMQSGTFSKTQKIVLIK
jgi:hypothetical protein